MNLNYFISGLFIFYCGTSLKAQNNHYDKPNIVIIHTDEHNFRTLGSYRETLSEEQALIWGKEAIVETPHIDRLAKEKYPGKVRPGKQIQKAYTMADFAPTILGLLGVDHSAYSFHGIDASADFESENMKVKDDRIVYLTNAHSNWVAAVNNNYKLVLSSIDKPWLFDLKRDPDEQINFYNAPEYQAVAQKLQEELFRLMELYNEPLQRKELQL